MVNSALDWYSTWARVTVLSVSILSAPRLCHLKHLSIVLCNLMLKPHTRLRGGSIFPSSALVSLSLLMAYQHRNALLHKRQPASWIIRGIYPTLCHAADEFASRFCPSVSHGGRAQPQDSGSFLVVVSDIGWKQSAKPCGRLTLNRTVHFVWKRAYFLSIMTPSPALLC